MQIRQRIVGATNSVRGPLAKQPPIRGGETSKLEETALGGHERDGAADVARLRQLAAGLLEAVAKQVLLGAEAVHVVERVAKRAFADASRARQIGDEEAAAGVVSRSRQGTSNDLGMRET